eukprot:CAMPEP_0198131112 /NCGR_PEP_ID=MMETSP1442-20131203/55410_1 /TAXON_ID= /ORGANISM="Craspedostauros australis, Strain CCMP3328" /LENGTH=137 /DNA_ID=CAMNT_0043791853 /DNA_START=224 /DNA_END=638 /DNA_ORIENTATION=-
MSQPPPPLQLCEHAVGDLDVQCARNENVWIEKRSIRESVEVCHHPLQLVVQQDGLAEEEDGCSHPEEDLEGTLDEPDVPHVTHRRGGHGGQIKEESLEPSQGEEAHIELMMFEVVRQYGKLDLDQPFEDAAADLQTA